MWDDLGAHSYLTDPTGQAVKTLEKNHGEFFRCLTVEVEKALDWTEDDVKLNKGIFLDDDGREVPPVIKVLESKLRNKRIFNVSRFHLD
jgi:hypothetical protein